MPCPHCRSTATTKRKPRTVPWMRLAEAGVP